MLNLEVGDTIEPFFYGDYWIEEICIATRSLALNDWNGWNDWNDLNPHSY
jgi:hypothetical protein